MNSLYKILSKKGRGGDTELRYVNGELAHVNTSESQLIDDYGKAGEDYVKEYGSGTINPETGLKEYVDPLTLITGAKLVYDVIGGAVNASAEAASNARVRKAIENQTQNLLGTLGTIDESRDLLLERALQSSELRKEDAFTDFLSKSENIQTATELAIGNADLATSGGLLERLSSGRQEVVTELSERNRALDFALEDRQLSILSDAEQQKAGIEAQVLQLEAEKARFGGGDSLLDKMRNMAMTKIQEARSVYG